MKTSIILTLLSIALVAHATDAQTPPAAAPEPTVEQLQTQYYQGIIQADEAQLRLAQKQFAAQQQQIADLQAKLAAATKATKKK